MSFGSQKVVGGAVLNPVHKLLTPVWPLQLTSLHPVLRLTITPWTQHWTTHHLNSDPKVCKYKPQLQGDEGKTQLHISKKSLHKQSCGEMMSM